MVGERKDNIMHMFLFAYRDDQLNKFEIYISDLNPPPLNVLVIVNSK